MCKNTVAKDPTVSLHQFPSSRLKWPEMPEKELKTHFRVCSRHFPGGDISREPKQ